MREKLTGFVHKKVTCPVCKKVGGITAMKKWHFEKCEGEKPYKARVTVDGKRKYLGKFATKEQAKMIVDNYLNDIKERI